MMGRWCPVCHRTVEKTRRGNIGAHLTSTRERPCPGGGQPWHITINTYSQP